VETLFRVQLMPPFPVIAIVLPPTAQHVVAPTQETAPRLAPVGSTTHAFAWALASWVLRSDTGSAIRTAAQMASDVRTAPVTFGRICLQFLLG
jgi:hypothetical protein